MPRLAGGRRAAVALALLPVLASCADKPAHAAARTHRMPGFSAVATTLPSGYKSATYDAARKSVWVVTRDPATRGSTLSRVAMASGHTHSWPLQADLEGYRSSSVGLDDTGAVWVGLGRSVVRFDPSSSGFTRWDVPPSIVSVSRILAQGGIVAIRPAGNGVHTLVSGLRRLINLSPGLKSPWALGPALTVTPTYGSRLIGLGTSDELVSGGIPLPGGEWQPAVARVSAASSRTLSGLVACVAQGPTAAVCTAGDGSISKVEDTTTPIPGATVKDVHLRLALAGPGQLWTWLEDRDRAVVMDTDTRTGRQASISFPRDTVTVDSHSTMSRIFGPATPEPSGSPIRIHIDPSPQALVVAGSQLWLLTRSGVILRDPNAKNAYAAAYRVQL